jgi:hypothetical protein
MVETVLTPPHPNPFEALLNEPCAGTLDHPQAHRSSQGFIRLLVDMIPLQQLSSRRRLPVTQHPPAGPAAAVRRPALAAQGCRRWRAGAAGAGSRWRGEKRALEIPIRSHRQPCTPKSATPRGRASGGAFFRRALQRPGALQGEVCLPVEFLAKVPWSTPLARRFSPVLPPAQAARGGAAPAPAAPQRSSARCVRPPLALGFPRLGPAACASGGQVRAASPRPATRAALPPRPA